MIRQSFPHQRRKWTPPASRCPLLPCASATTCSAVLPSSTLSHRHHIQWPFEDSQIKIKFISGWGNLSHCSEAGVTTRNINTVWLIRMHKNQLFVYSVFFLNPNSGPKPTQIPTANTESTFLSLTWRSEAILQFGTGESVIGRAPVSFERKPRFFIFKPSEKMSQKNPSVRSKWKNILKIYSSASPGHINNQAKVPTGHRSWKLMRSWTWAARAGPSLSNSVFRTAQRKDRCWLRCYIPQCVDLESTKAHCSAECLNDEIAPQYWSNFIKSTGGDARLHKQILRGDRCHREICGVNSREDRWFECFFFIIIILY